LIKSEEFFKKIMEESGCGIIKGTISTFAWRDQGKPRKTSDNVVGFPVQIAVERKERK
jgi:hypothetical protein